jgi:cytochrome c553
VKRIPLVILALVSIVTMSFVWIEEARYDNLKVLPKDTNKYQMDSVMKHFSSALGVNCDFCHVRTADAMRDWDFASDSSGHKEAAREMMLMTNDINEKHFGIKNPSALNTRLVITCVTCHNGKVHPARFVKPPPAPRTFNDVLRSNGN